MMVSYRHMIPSYDEGQSSYDGIISSYDRGQYSYDVSYHHMIEDSPLMMSHIII